jgi:DNA-binding NarL/FixJ family response regulator
MLPHVPDTAERLRLLLADDQVVSLRGASYYLTALKFEVCATLADPRRLRVAFEQHRPDVVVIEALMGGRGTVFSEIRDLLRYHPSARVLVLTSDLSPAIVDAAVETGCLGVVPKTCSVDALGNAVRAVANGDRFLHPRALAALLQTRQARDDRRGIKPLSSRELAVLSAVAEGLTNNEIAAQLGITAETVKTHLAHVQDKLGARDRTHAVSRALRLGVLT